MPSDLFPADWLVTFEYEETVLGALKSGKESEVYLVARSAHGRTSLFAEKRFLSRDHRLFRNTYAYVGIWGNGNGRDDRQAARVQTRAQPRGRRGDNRRRPRSRCVVRRGVWRRAGLSHPDCDNGRDTIMTTSSLSALEEIQAREARHVLQTYRRAPVAFVRGQGVRLYDSEGREYLDLLAASVRCSA